MIFLLLKITAILAVTQFGLLFLRRATAAMRHMIRATALASSLALPFLPKISPASIPIRVPGIATFSITAGAPHTAPWTIATALLTLWAAGTLLLLTRACLGYIRLRGILGNATPSAVIEGTQIVTADISTPFVSGLRKPRIALPVAWPAEFREAAILHELAHVRRKDLWTELLSRLACAAYWFHPLVWIHAARLREERESACDDAVLHSGFDALSYAEALVAAARRAAKTPLSGCSMAQTTSLKSRTARLFDSTMPRMSNPSTLLRAALGCTLVFAAVGVLSPASAQIVRKTVAHTSAPAPVLLAQNAPPPNQATPATPAAEPDTAAPSADPVPPADNIYKIGNGVSQPGVISKVDPVYPEELKDQKISGSVQLQIVVDPNGTARDIQIMKSLGAGFDDAAISAVLQWRFAPARLNNEPVAVRALVEVNFRLL